MKIERLFMLSVLFNDPHIFGYIRNTWSLRRSLAKCLTEELDIPMFQTSKDIERYGLDAYLFDNYF